MDQAALTAHFLDNAEFPHAPDGVGTGESEHDAMLEFDVILHIDPDDCC